MDTETGCVLADLSHDGSKATVAQGGQGGRIVYLRPTEGVAVRQCCPSGEVGGSLAGGLGNAEFVSATCQRPLEHTLGEEGDRRVLDLEMKTIADVGLVREEEALSPTLDCDLVLSPARLASPMLASPPFCAPFHGPSQWWLPTHSPPSDPTWGWWSTTVGPR